MQNHTLRLFLIIFKFKFMDTSIVNIIPCNFYYFSKQIAILNEMIKQCKDFLNIASQIECFENFLI